MNLFDDLQYRGLIKDVADIEVLKKMLAEKSCVYIGVDPTADSLHIGHLQQIILLARYQRAGHKVIALCGGATGMIGDPRPTSERKLLTLKECQDNVSSIRKQIEKIIDLSDENKGILVNNYDWIKEISLIDFLREYGKNFNVSYMLNKDIVAKRIEKGISYTEFTYTILQALDFLYLYENFDCRLQIGGSDQWGNILSGVDLIKKVKGSETLICGTTSPLITKSDGSKFGKSEGQNIWLDINKTSAYDFYQFWLNISDEDCRNLLKKFSLKTIDEIKELEKSIIETPHLRLAQKALASELTLLIHGPNELDKAIKITETLFKGNITSLTIDELKEGLKGAKSATFTEPINILDALINLGVCTSKGEARKLIQGLAITINDQKIADINHTLNKDDAINQELSIIKKGKKHYYIAYFK